jgi:hypothetical protein
MLQAGEHFPVLQITCRFGRSWRNRVEGICWNLPHLFNLVLCAHGNFVVHLSISVSNSPTSTLNMTEKYILVYHLPGSQINLIVEFGPVNVTRTCA